MADLSERRAKVAALAAQGLSYKEIARRVGTTKGAVSTDLREIRRAAPASPREGVRTVLVPAMPNTSTAAVDHRPVSLPRAPWEDA